MAYTKTNWENDVTELSAENFNHIEDGIYNSTNLELYGVYNEISEVPTNTPNGKLFYLSSTNKIYEVTNTGAYHEFAEPISGIFYIVPSEQKNYAYNGETLVSVGGGGGSVTGDTLPIGSEVDYNGTNVPAGWEKVNDEVVLYENASGTIGNVPLSDNPKNYKTIKIHFIDQDDLNMKYQILEYDTDKDKITVSSSIVSNISPSIACQMYNIKNNQLEKYSSYAWGPTNGVFEYSTIRITKVVGYK